VEIQPFETVPTSNDVTCDDPAQTVTSRNVIATKPGDDHVIVVGAHIDSVTAGSGAGDNASGVAAMLAAAEALSTVEMTYTVVFVAFGAEEGGCPTGSDYYLETLGDQTGQIVAMINVDSVGMGTTLNVYAGAAIAWSNDSDYPEEISDGPTWVRDLALSLADEMGLPFETTPSDTWKGYIGPWSDHYGFTQLDIPIAYFEAWQWSGTGVTDPWWGTETAAGDMMHTSLDVYENVVPEKVEMAAELVAATAYAIQTADQSGE
jgi:Zn-dependent M28 family amino/carboxypeptidase